MKINKAIFKAYDIRGKVGIDLNLDIARSIGRALADLLETPGAVAVGYDMRPASVEYAAALREGIREQGRDVVDIGLVTSDMIYFAVGSEKLAGGAMITASHNPGGDDGIKLCRREASPIGIDTGLLKIERAVVDDDFKKANIHGSITRQNLNHAWIKHALGFVDPLGWPAYKVGVDAGNGMAGAILPGLKGLTPLELKPLYWELDGTFPNHPASPIDQKNLVDLVELIRRDSLDFGIAFDGDGDRAFLVDSKGQQVSGTVMTAIIAEAMLAKHPGATILYNAICGRVVPETISRLGGIGVRTKVGHSYIKIKMRELDSPFAGEHSGHFYFKDNYFADSGLIAALVAIDVLAKSGLSLLELADKYRTYFDSGEINYKVTNKQATIEGFRDHFKDGVADDLDGLTINYPDWWFNVRPSNTEPYIRINIEANSKELLNAKTVEIIHSLPKGSVQS
jgi:phosphomannomutase